MKFFYFIFTILSLTSSYGQVKNIYLEYEIILQNEPDLFKENTMMRGLFENAIKEANNVTFELIVTKKGSKFSIKKNLESDGNKRVVGFTLAMLHYSGIIYSLNNKLLIQNSILGDNIYLEKDLIDNWILSDETKLIGDYLCYKANNIYKVINNSKTFEHPVVAWYCPKLPYKHGPNGYGNLPGLILELQVRNIMFGAKIIKFNNEMEFDLNFLNRIKKLNEMELENAYKKFNGY